VSACSVRATIGMGMGALFFAGASCVGARPIASAELAARAYPVKAVRLIVAASPGGTADFAARVIGARLNETWQQPVVIDNRPGANGIIGTEMAARAAPDGYTLLMVGAGLAISPSLYARVPYDPVRDFVPITQAIAVANVLVMHPSGGFASLADMVGAARAKPGTVTFGSAGHGTPGHLILELFQLAAGARFSHAPQRGGRSALHELLGAQVHALFSIAPAALPHVRAGRLKALAVASGARTRAAPDVPTLAESGYPGFDVTGWFGILVPAGTPEPIVARLNAEIVRTLRLPDIEQRLRAQAADAVANDPRAFARHVAAETQRWSKVIKQVGIKPH